MQDVHAALNAAYNALAVDRSVETLRRDARLACEYLAEARAAIEAIGTSGSRLSAAVPGMTRASMLLSVEPDELRVAEALAQIGSAMDEVERALAEAGH